MVGVGQVADVDDDLRLVGGKVVPRGRRVQGLPDVAGEADAERVLMAAATVVVRGRGGGRGECKRNGQTSQLVGLCKGLLSPCFLPPKLPLLLPNNKPE